MTTPFQAAPDGAVTVGGGTWNYGQTLDEAVARAAFEFPMPTPGNMIDLLRIALESLPIDALKPFANFLGLVDGVFDNIADAVNQIVGSLVERVFQTVEDFGEFLHTLFTDPGSLIGNLFGVVMDGIETIGDFLKKLWENFTGNVAVGTKNVLDAVTAAGGIKTTLGNTKSTADTARDNLQITWNELYDGLDGTSTPSGTSRTASELRGRGAAVRSSAKIGEGYYLAGANILINPGFEDPAFIILNNGVGVTANVGTGDVVRSGLRSMRLIAAAGSPFSMLAANTTAQVHLPCSAGETYYLEAWVFGKATNSQVTAVNGIAFGIQTYTAAKAFIANTQLNFNGGNAVKGVWTKISGRVTVPANAVFFTPFIQLSSGVLTNGETYYFDDVVVREVTDAAVADAKVVATNQALYGANVPAAAITTNAVPSLSTAKITSGTFGSGFIADGAILEAKIATDAVTNAKIATNAVTGTEIAANAVGSTQLEANAVTDVKINAAAVTTAKIANDAVDNSKIAANAVTATEIATGAVGSTQIASSAVTNDKVATGQDASKITTGSLDTARVPGVTNLQTSIVAGYTVVTVSTSQTWTKPANLSEIYVACFGGGAKGGTGQSGTSGTRLGGTGGAVGGFISQQLNPTDVPATVACTIGSGTATTPGITSFGSLLGSDDAFKGYIAHPLGLLTTGASATAGGNGGQATVSTGSNGTAGAATIVGVAGGTAGAGAQPAGSTPGGAGGAGGAGINFGLCQTSGSGGGGGGGKAGSGFTYPPAGAGGAGGFPSGGGGGGGATCGTSSAGTPGVGGNGGNGLLLIIYKVANT